MVPVPPLGTSATWLHSALRSTTKTAIRKFLAALGNSPEFAFTFIGVSFDGFSDFFFDGSAFSRFRQAPGDPK
jgi:hypothetical protein